MSCDQSVACQVYNSEKESLPLKTPRDRHFLFSLAPLLAEQDERGTLEKEQCQARPVPHALIFSQTAKPSRRGTIVGKIFGEVNTRRLNL